MGKGIDFPDICIKSGINFQNFGIRNGTDFLDFGMKHKVGYDFQKFDIRNGYVFEALMARPRPKSSQVHPWIYDVMNQKTCDSRHVIHRFFVIT